MRHHYLVTTYNHIKYFNDMLATIRSQYCTLQDFLTQAQVLIVDDCSTDGTKSVLAAATARFPNVHAYINPVNQGIGRNRNFLLDWVTSRALAPSDFVLFVDGDDLLPATHMRDKLALFTAEPELECVGGQLSLFYGDNLLSQSSVDTFSPDPQIQDIANLFECHFYVSNAMFRGHVFKNPAIRFPETPTSEDWLFFASVPLKKRHCEQVTLLYRRHDNNLTTRDFGPGVVFALRKSARVLGLLRIAMHPSDRDCELLDLVGYLSFQAHWCGARSHVAANCHMPWFNYLKDQPELRPQWPSVRAEIAALFARIIGNNARVPAYNPTKLQAYLQTLMQAADAEMRLDV